MKPPRYGLDWDGQLAPAVVTWLANFRPCVRCTAHRSDGWPCRAFAMHGQLVCSSHGGLSPQARRAALYRLAESGVQVCAARALRRLGRRRP